MPSIADESLPSFLIRAGYTVRAPNEKLPDDIQERGEIISTDEDIALTILQAFLERYYRESDYDEVKVLRTYVDSTILKAESGFEIIQITIKQIRPKLATYEVKTLKQL